ncbi:YchJ family metal-binding protein [Serinibacter salmoneus]
MRSRFTAYALGDLAYVARTWHPSTRPADLSPDPDTTWVALQIVETTAGRESDDTGTVHFRASFRTPTGRDVLEEISRFTRQNGAWVYVDGDILT